jgi:hypothetical protein
LTSKYAYSRLIGFESADSIPPSINEPSFLTSISLSLAARYLIDSKSNYDSVWFYGGRDLHSASREINDRIRYISAFEKGRLHWPEPPPSRVVCPTHGILFKIAVDVVAHSSPHHSHAVRPSLVSFRLACHLGFSYTPKELFWEAIPIPFRIPTVRDDREAMPIGNTFLSPRLGHHGCPAFSSQLPCVKVSQFISC